MIYFIISEKGTKEDRTEYIKIYPEVFSSKKIAKQALLYFKAVKYLFEFILFIPEYQEKIQKVYYHPDYSQSLIEDIKKNLSLILTKENFKFVFPNTAKEAWKTSAFSRELFKFYRQKKEFDWEILKRIILSPYPFYVQFQIDQFEITE